MCGKWLTYGHARMRRRVRLPRPASHASSRISLAASAIRYSCPACKSEVFRTINRPCRTSFCAPRACRCAQGGKRLRPSDRGGGPGRLGGGTPRAGRRRMSGRGARAGWTPEGDPWRTTDRRRVPGSGCDEAPATEGQCPRGWRGRRGGSFGWPDPRGCVGASFRGKYDRADAARCAQPSRASSGPATRSVRRAWPAVREAGARDRRGRGP